MQAAGDRTLLERTAVGDLAAFETLVHRWEAPLHRFLRRVTKSDSLAEEARQWTWIRIHEKAGSYRGGAARVFLFRTALRCALRVLERERSRRAEPLESAAQVESAAPRPDQQAASRETHASVRICLDRLPPTDRALVWLCVVDATPLEEAARILRRPASTLRYRLTRALEGVRRELVPREGRRPAPCGESDELR